MKLPVNVLCEPLSTFMHSSDQDASRANTAGRLSAAGLLVPSSPDTKVNRAEVMNTSADMLFTASSVC